MKTKVSVIWMTRKRESELVFSLTSFIVNADDNTNVEYIIVGDPDDPGTEKALSDKAGGGKGLILGICVAFIALIFDNLIRTWVDKRKKHLGLA